MMCLLFEFFLSTDIDNITGRAPEHRIPVQSLSHDGRKRHGYRPLQEGDGSAHPSDPVTKIQNGVNIMENKISTATIVRTICLLVALSNQLLSAFGKSPLPIDNTQLEQLVTSLITIVVALINWWQNNSFTQEAIAADQLYDTLRKRNGK